MPLQEYDQIKLKPEIQGTLGDRDAIDSGRNRTPGKDEVAEYVQKEVVEQGRWPMNMTDLGEETGYSRQHVSNVINDYFVGVDEDKIEMGDPVDHSSPMSASPGQPRSTPQDTTTPSSGQTKSVFIRINNHIEEIEIAIPEDVEHTETYVRGFLDAVERQG